MTHRLAIAASSREELQKALAVAAPTEAGVGTVAAARGKLAFLFTGQGAQVPGMGRALCAEWPAFRAELDRCVALFDQELDRPLREVMWAAPGSADAALLDQTLYTQPALFVIEHALVALWRSWGVEPDFVAGHSIGELTAACVAGVFCREDAVRLVAARARLMQALPATGAMVSIAASEQAVAALVAPYQEAVSIAAVNGPLQVVISGDEQAVLAIAAECTERRVHTRRLRVSHAFHSPTMQPMLAAFSQVAESIVYQRPSRPLISNLSGNLDDGETATPDYWVRHVREAVRFAAGVKALHAAGATTFLEVGPRSTLLRLIPDCLPEAEPTTLIASLRAGSEESASMLAALGSLWSGGSSVTWTGVFPAGGRRVLLPTYPWQRQRYWLEAPEAAEALRGARTTSHPLLGRRVPVAGSGAVFESVLGLSTQAWLGDHKVAGQIVVPGAALAELLLAAARAHAVSSASSRDMRRPSKPMTTPALAPSAPSRCENAACRTVPSASSFNARRRASKSTSSRRCPKCSFAPARSAASMHVRLSRPRCTDQMTSESSRP